MGTKPKPVIDLDKKRMLMMSSILWDNECIFYGLELSKFRDRSAIHIWRHSVDDVNNHLFLLRPTAGTSFKSVPLLAPKTLKICVLGLQVCEIHKGHVTQKMTTNYVYLFSRGITTEYFRSIPCLVLRIPGGPPTSPWPPYIFKFRLFN